MHAGLLLLARILASHHPHARISVTSTRGQMGLGNYSSSHVVWHAAHESWIHAHAHGIARHAERWPALHAAWHRHVLPGVRHPVAVVHTHAAHGHAWMLLIANLLLLLVLWLLLHSSRLWLLHWGPLLLLPWLW